MSGPLIALMSVTTHLNLLLIKTWSICFAVLLSAEYHVSLLISLCGNAVLLTLKPLDIANWIIFILLLLVSLCKLSLPVLGFYVFLSTFALKSPSIISMSELAIYLYSALINCKILLLPLPFFCLLVHVHLSRYRRTMYYNMIMYTTHSALWI